MPDSTTLPPSLQSLLMPAAYPHAVETIHLLETHISWVLLAGEFAYKLKKPVDLGFLDFSSLELRRHFCEEELRLNCRLIDDLYLAVVPIVRQGEQLQISEAGTPIVYPPVEYAVQMRQFDQHQLAIEQLRSGQLSMDELQQFAATLAAFHESATRLTPSEIDITSSVETPVVENFEVLRRSGLGAAVEESLSELESWSHTMYERLSEIFEARLEGGFVRDCHGDLHLGNIVAWQGSLKPFDCIEFSKSLRSIDVVSEIAFLVMDLEDHNRSDLANGFLNAYLQQTGDYQGLHVLKFYLVYRSLVRAKVAAIRLGQSDLPETEVDSIRQVCNDYLQLARNFIAPQFPTLAITHGLSGSGKTTGTEPLILKEGAIRIRSDVERKRIFGLLPLDDAEQSVGAGIYSSEANRQTEKRLLSLATAILQAGYSVIVDATFLKRAQRQPFEQLAQSEQVPYRIYHFEADVATLRERIKQRQQEGNDASDATVAVLDHQLETAEPLTDEEQRVVQVPLQP